MYGYGQIKHMEDDVEPFDPHKDEDGAYLATALVAYALGLKTEDVFSAVFSSGRGSRAAVQARHIAIYLTHAGLGMSLARVSRAFGRDRSTVAYACHVVEDRREDVDFRLGVLGTWRQVFVVGFGALLRHQIHASPLA